MLPITTLETPLQVEIYHRLGDSESADRYTRATRGTTGTTFAFEVSTRL